MDVRVGLWRRLSTEECFWTVVLEKTLDSPLDCKEIQPVHSEGDQPWDLFGRNDAKAETLVLWPPHVKSWLIGKDWCWEGFGAGGEGDDRGWDGWMASPTRWSESEWTPGVGDGQGGLACCSSWGRKESDMTERLNWTELNWTEATQHACSWGHEAGALTNGISILIGVLRSLLLLSALHQVKIQWEVGHLQPWECSCQNQALLATWPQTFSSSNTRHK